MSAPLKLSSCCGPAGALLAVWAEGGQRLPSALPRALWRNSQQTFRDICLNFCQKAGRWHRGRGRRAPHHRCQRRTRSSAPRGRSRFPKGSLPAAGSHCQKPTSIPWEPAGNPCAFQGPAWDPCLATGCGLFILLKRRWEQLIKAWAFSLVETRSGRRGTELY